MVEAVGMIASSSAPLTVRPRSRVVALILTWVAVVACGRESVPAARAAVALPTVLVETMTVSAPLSLASQLFVEHDAVVAARASGMLPVGEKHRGCCSGSEGEEERWGVMQRRTEHLGQPTRRT